MLILFSSHLLTFFLFYLIFWSFLSRGSGAVLIVFGLVTPLDHPPDYTSQHLYIYIIYIIRPPCSNPLGGLGGVVEWGHETKNITVNPDPRDSLAASCEKV